MKTLNEEAERWIAELDENDLPENYDIRDTPFNVVKSIYIAGANSKYVKNQIIQAQIDAINSIRYSVENADIVQPILQKKIQELQKQLT